MCTYLKNMAGWKPKDLKIKSFANIQELFDKAFKRVNTFIDFRTELVEGTEMEESSKKAKNAKKQKVDDDQEAAKMKELMKIVPDEEEVAVDAIPLATKPPSIVDWKIVKEGKISYYQIIRADRSSKRRCSIYSMAGEDAFHDDNPPPPPPVTPTQQAPHILSTIKLPILKKGEYDIWAMKMEHYLGHTNYPIWEVIQKVELNKQKGKAIGQGENRPMWNNVQRLNHQNKFVPKAVLTKTGIFPVNAARQNPSSQAAETSTTRKVNTARPIDDPQKDLKNKGIVDSDVQDDLKP
ncbi:hypothetical protein Tco_0663145 [Tanacetum coccineum]